jgi:O-antigen ligase
MTISNSNALTTETVEAKETTETVEAKDLGAVPKKELSQDDNQAVEETTTFASGVIIFLLCLTIIFSTLAFGTVHNWSLSIFYCGAMIVGLLWVMDAWRTGKLRFSESYLQLPLIGVLFLGFIQLLPFGSPQLQDGALTISYTRSLSLDPFATRMALVQIAAITVFFAAALSFIDSPKRFRIVTRTIIIFGFLIAIQGLIQKFSSPTKIFWLREPEFAFPFGPFINSGHFAALMEMTLALTLGALFSGGVDKDQRVLYGFMATVMFVAMLLTQSRGAFIVGIVIVMSLLIGRNLLYRSQIESDERKEKRRRKFLIRLIGSIGIGITTIILMLVLTIWFGGFAGIERIFNYSEANHPAGGGRVHYWSGAVQIILDNPFIGVGLEGFGVAFTQYDTLNGSYRIERAHNDYLQVLTDTGIVGAGLALAFIVLLFRKGLACYKDSRDRFRRGVCLGALVGCFAVLLHSFFEFPLRTTSNALLFLILAALATVEIRKEDSPKKHKPRKWRRRKLSSYTTRFEQ